MNRGSGSFAPQHCLNKDYFCIFPLWVCSQWAVVRLDTIAMEVIQNAARMYYTVAKTHC